MKRALITGIAGQDGSYLAELLLSKGYEVHGVIRVEAVEDPEKRLWRIHHLQSQIRLHTASLDSHAELFKLVDDVRPDECYHLASLSFVSHSFQDELITLDTNIHATHYLLAALKEHAPRCRFAFAGSGEMFGNARQVPQTEDTPFHPRSAYGIAKVAGFDLTRIYREVHGLHAGSAILFNHESPRRDSGFVTRKISHHVARIKLGLAQKLPLGDLDARRDWGHARDYVHALSLMLQQPKADDYLIATGSTHSVRDFCDAAFGHVGLRWQDHVVTDPALVRPAETPRLGEPSKAKRVLGWSPTCGFEDLVKEMVDEDLRRLKNGH